MLPDDLNLAIDNHLKNTAKAATEGKSAIDWAAVFAMGIKILLTILPLLTPVSPYPPPLAKAPK